MSGGPSQMDTFDLKPGTTNGGPFKEIQTSAPGLRISEHLPKIAKFGDRMAVIRSMSTKEGDHSRATFYLRTGYLPQGPIQYPLDRRSRRPRTGQRRVGPAQRRRHRAVHGLQPRRPTAPASSVRSTPR